MFLSAVRSAFCLVILSAGTVSLAQAQKPTASYEPRNFTVGAKPLPLRAYLADSLREVTLSLPAGSTAAVVGSYGRNWAIVERSVPGNRRYQYYAPASGLLDFSPALYQGQEKAAQDPFPIDAANQHISYQAVVEVPGVSKDELYTRAYEWMAKTYRSANAVIQMNDKEAGRLVGKGATIVAPGNRLMSMTPSYVRHTLTLYIKDGRYKYVLTDFEYVPAFFASGGSQGKGATLEEETPDVWGGAKRWNLVRREAKRDAYTLTTLLQEAMSPKKGQDASDF